MALFAWVAVFVFARRLMPGLGEMLIAAPAASTISNEHALAGVARSASVSLDSPS